MIRHLGDLCRKAERTGIRCYSGFLSLAEQQDFQQSPEARGMDFHFWGGSEWAERKILASGREEIREQIPEYPIAVMEIQPASEKYAEKLTHRDFLGAILNLGIERELIGDILVREKHAWVFCLQSAAELLSLELRRVRQTTVTVREAEENVPLPEPDFESLSVNVASERLDTIVAGWVNLSRAKASELFRAEKISVNGRIQTDGSRTVPAGTLISVRGYGKAIYDGISRETRKNRLVVQLRKYK